MNLIKLLSLSCVLPLAFSEFSKASEEKNFGQDFEQKVVSSPLSPPLEPSSAAQFPLIPPLSDDELDTENPLESSASKRESRLGAASSSDEENQSVASESNGMFEDLNSMISSDGNIANESDSSDSRFRYCHGKRVHSMLHPRLRCKDPCEKNPILECLDQLAKQETSISNLIKTNEKTKTSLATLARNQESYWSKNGFLEEAIGENKIAVMQKIEELSTDLLTLQKNIRITQQKLREKIEKQTQIALDAWEKNTTQQLEKSESHFVKLIQALNMAIGIDPSKCNEDGIPLINNNRISNLQKMIEDLQGHYKNFAGYLGDLSRLENIQSLINLDPDFGLKQPITLEKTINFLAEFIKKNLDQLDERIAKVMESDLKALLDADQKYEANIVALQKALQPIQETLENITHDDLMKLKDLEKNIEGTVQKAVNSDAFQRSINEKVSVLSQTTIVYEVKKANENLVGKLTDLSKRQDDHAITLAEHTGSVNLFTQQIQVLMRDLEGVQPKLEKTQKDVDGLDQSFQDYRGSSAQTFDDFSKNLKTLEDQYAKIQGLIGGSENEGNPDDETKDGEEVEKQKPLMERLATFEKDLAEVRAQLKEEINDSNLTRIEHSEKLNEHEQSLRRVDEQAQSIRELANRTESSFVEFKSLTDQAIKNFSDSLNRLTGTDNDFGTTLATIQNALKSVNTTADSAKMEASEALQKIEQLDQRLTPAESNIQSLKEQMGIANLQIESSQNNITELTNFRTEDKTLLDQVIEAASKNSGNIERNVESIRVHTGQIEVLTNDATRDRSEVSTFKLDFENAKKDLETLHDSFQEIQEQVSQGDTKTALEIQTLSEKTGENAGNIVLLQDAVATQIPAKFDEVKNQMTVAEQSIVKLETLAEDHTNQINTISEKAKEMDEAIAKNSELIRKIQSETVPDFQGLFDAISEKAKVNDEAIAKNSELIHAIQSETVPEFQNQFKAISEKTKMTDEAIAKNSELIHTVQSETIPELQGLTQEIKKVADQATEDVTALKSKTVSTDIQVEAAQKSIESTSKEVEILQNNFVKAQTDIETLQTGVGTLQTGIDTLKEETLVFRSDLTNTQGEQASLGTTVSKQQDSLSELADFQKDMTAFQSEVTTQNTAAKNQIDTLNGKVLALESSVETLKEVDPAGERLTTLEGNLNTLGDSFDLFNSNCSDNYTSLGASLTLVNKSIETLKAEVYSTGDLDSVSRIDTLEGQVSDLISMVTAIADKNTLHEKSLDAIVNKNNWYEERFKNLETLMSTPPPKAPESVPGGR